MPHRWSNCAELRRAQIESGVDITYNHVFEPIFRKKVSALDCNSILEVGAGTGHLSKALANAGHKLTAIEPSEGMYVVAKDVLRGTSVNLINCAVGDLPVEEEYEVAISHLVAHVVDEIDEFFQSVAGHIDKAGHFIFSIPHPCFFNGYKNLFGNKYTYIKTQTKDISFSITKDKTNLITGVPYHHRPLSCYINALVRSGFAIDELEETWPTTAVQSMYGQEWENPRYCVFTCKKL
jgi:2-polyprenyl-3-methyl-5-hydroxy-6-metoxy-1,4-benzoquinol methylase